MVNGYSKYYRICLLFMLVAVLGLTACSGSGGSSVSNTTISGVASKGLIHDATVTVMSY